MTGRVLIVAHSHPEMSHGGGEIAAYRQFEKMRLAGYDVSFVGLCANHDLRGRLFGLGQDLLELGERDYILQVDEMSSFLMETKRPEQEDRLVEFLRSRNPDVLHLHHIWKLGAGTLRRLRAARPHMKIYLTVHEYALICANHGQMVKTDGGTLCYAADEISCAKCFPGRSPFDFIIRKSRLMHVANLCDRLISPSQFLASRLIEWGVPAERVDVIENGLPDMPDLPAPEPDTDDDLIRKSSRFAYFGNGTPTKGLNVLLDATRALARQEGAPQVSVDVHGVNAARFQELWPDHTIPENVTFRGRYAPEQAISLMRGFGWIVIPSIWWENSPVIIQEARAARTPMLFSDIGGTAERAAGAGFGFPVGDAVALARRMAQVAGDGDLLRRWKAEMAPPMTMDDYMRAWENGASVTGETV